MNRPNSALRLVLAFALLFGSAPAWADVKQGCRCSNAGLPSLALALPAVAAAVLLARRVRG